MVLVALGLPLFFSVCLLVIDGSRVFVQKRSMQNAADASALAAVQELAVGAACDAACKARVLAKAQEFSSANAGPTALSNCNGDAAKTDCYQLSNGDQRVQVRLRSPNSVSNFFGPVLSLFGVSASTFQPSARAAAVKTAITVQQCVYDNGDVDPTWQPGDPLCRRPGPPLAPTTPAVIFAYGTGCDALRVHNGGPGGSFSVFNGALVSNGAYDIDSGVHGDLLRHRDNTADGTLGHGYCGSPVDSSPRDGIADVLSAGWNRSNPPGKADKLELIPNADCTQLPTRCKSWPIGNPTVAPCQGCAPGVPSGSMANWWVQERGTFTAPATFGPIINEKQCTDAGDTFDVGQLVAGNAYCNSVKITVKANVQQLGAAGVALIAPKLVISAGVKIAPLAALYKHPDPSGCATIGGLQLFAWDTATSTVDVKTAVHWGGGMFVPNGGVSITSVDSVASSGYIQAKEVDYGSGGASFNGTGTCQSGGGPGPDDVGHIVGTAGGVQLSLDE